MVAYILTPAGGQVLLELADEITESPGPTLYSTWDSKIEEFLRVRKLDGYLPWRNYGERGGKPNSEHKRAGLSSVHRADLLYGKLAFTPLYVESKKYSNLSFFFTRTQARIKGMGRLLLGGTSKNSQGDLVMRSWDELKLAAKTNGTARVLGSAITPAKT